MREQQYDKRKEWGRDERKGAFGNNVGGFRSCSACERTSVFLLVFAFAGLVFVRCFRCGNHAVLSRSTLSFLLSFPYREGPAASRNVLER